MAARVVWIDQAAELLDRVAKASRDDRPPVADGGKWVLRAWDCLIAKGADGLTEGDWREQFAIGCGLANGSIRTTFGRAVDWLARNEYTRVDLAEGGLRLFRMSHRDEIANSSMFARFAADGAG